MSNLEFKNSITVRGIVGRATRTALGKDTHISFSVVTNYAYIDNDGSPVVETTWHNVSVVDNPSVISREDLALLDRGAAVEVVGRLRARRFVNENGNDAYCYEIAPRKVSVLRCEAGQRLAEETADSADE